MTPKDKAAELVDKFRNVEVVVKFSDRFLYKHEAKECAIIAVDEILNNDGFTQFDQYLTEFWQEVKKQIEAL